MSTLLNAQTVVEAVHHYGKPAAMVVCDMAGYPVDSAALARAAGIADARVVVDAAHGPGGEVGRHADPAKTPFATCLSFYATKNLPIGEGGATRDEESAGWARSARLRGMSRDAWRRYLPGGSWRYDVREVGFTCNLTDLQAAIGREQVRALPGWQQRRAEIFARHDAACAELVASGDIVLPDRHPGRALPPYQMWVGRRDDVVAELAKADISTSVHFIIKGRRTLVTRAGGYPVLPAQRTAQYPDGF